MDFDILRRGVVLPVVDEAVSMSAILGRSKDPDAFELASTVTSESQDRNPSNRYPENTNQNSNANSAGQKGSTRPSKTTLSQDAALYELRAIPLYFPTSFALVKPYVEGFEISSLDAPLLTGVSINSDWQPKRQ
jgi:hypothetical protein